MVFTARSINFRVNRFHQTPWSLPHLTCWTFIWFGDAPSFRVMVVDAPSLFNVPQRLWGLLLSLHPCFQCVVKVGNQSTQTGIIAVSHISVSPYFLTHYFSWQFSGSLVSWHISYSCTSYLAYGGPDPHSSNGPVGIEDIRRFWRPHDLEYCLTSSTACRASLFFC